MTRSQRTGRSRYIIVNTISSYGRDIVDAATLIILTPFIISMIGRESFGLWSLLWAFINLLTLIDMGFGTSVVKYVADAKGKGDIDRQKRTVVTLFWIYSALGSILLGCVGLSMLFFNSLFEIPEQHRLTAQAVMLQIGLRSALNMPFGMFRGVLVGYQKLSVANLYKVLAAIVYFASVLLFLRIFPDLRTLAILNLIAGVWPMVAMLIHAKLTLPGVSLNPRYFDFKIVKEVSSFSVYFMIIQVSTLIATKVDAMIIQKVLALEMVAVYTIAMRLSEKGQQFCFQLIKTLTPVVAELHGAGETQNIRAVWRTGSKLTIAFAAPLLVGLVLLAKPLINSWVGAEFNEQQVQLSVWACQWLAGAAMIMVIHGNTANVLSMRGQQKFLAYSMIGGQLLNLTLTILFVRPLGIPGVAMATLISALISQVYIQIHAGLKFDYSIKDFYFQTLFPVLVPILLMTTVFSLIQRNYTLTNLLEVAILELIGVILFWLTFWWIGFNQQERKYFKEKLLRKFLRKKSN